ncbi:MAG: hypothetical protein M1834_001132 [Cirrosporium novae-zelandiae]|nr:MAG: hypothetical protein M1834_001132 [Cirrosporium novae-zelandiae]
MSQDEDFAQRTSAFRAHLPDLNTPRFQNVHSDDAYAHAHRFLTQKQPPWLHELVMTWKKLYKEPYNGITTNGQVMPNLYPIQDEHLPISSIVASVEAVFSLCSSPQKEKLQFPADAKEWRAWSNPEILINPLGLRLEEVSPELASAILNVLQTTLSPEGYEKALGAMRINHFLGELVGGEKIMNEQSYNFLVFGTPSTTDYWGWSLYGHHLCLNVFLYRHQIVIAPFFTGAEPNLIDQGPYAGTRILNQEETLGLQLMQSLPPTLQACAQTYKLMKDPAMSIGTLARWNKDDQRHLCGAFRDNRTVPYEGIPISSFSPTQQSLILNILTQFLLYLPATSRRIKLDSCKAHFSTTYFSWIGGYGDNDPFYYRIQSPVIIVEFDHHSGVFLSNQEPAKFHIHTLLRMPNRGDYGVALREQIRGNREVELNEGVGKAML